MPNPPVTKPKKVWKEIHGVLLLDKPQGMTSNDALQKARRLFSAAKGGHTGTLDPMATGLLPICFGDATKFSADLLDADKSYETVLKLGQTTDTGDAEGAVLETRSVAVSTADVVAVLPRFMGDILQTPPMYSALKRDGRPLYELARQGIEVERAARAIHIGAIDLLGGPSMLPDGTGALRLRVQCSKGTYIRVLGEDIGAALGCGAHLTLLRRLTVGTLQLAGSVTLAALEAMDEADRLAYLQPVDALLSSLPAVVLTEPAQQRFAHGNPVPLQEQTGGVEASSMLSEGGLLRVYAWATQQLLGTGRLDEQGLLWPKRLVSGATTCQSA